MQRLRRSVWIMIGGAAVGFCSIALEMGATIFFSPMSAVARSVLTIAVILSSIIGGALVVSALLASLIVLRDIFRMNIYKQIFNISIIFGTGAICYWPIELWRIMRGAHVLVIGSDFLDSSLWSAALAARMCFAGLWICMLVALAHGSIKIHKPVLAIIITIGCTGVAALFIAFPIGNTAIEVAAWYWWAMAGCVIAVLAGIWRIGSVIGHSPQLYLDRLSGGW